MTELIILCMVLFGGGAIGLFVMYDNARIVRLKRGRYDNPFPDMKNWRDQRHGMTNPFADDISPSEARCLDEGWLKWNRTPGTRMAGEAVLTEKGLAALADWEARQ